MHRNAPFVEAIDALGRGREGPRLIRGTHFGTINS